MHLHVNRAVVIAFAVLLVLLPDSTSAQQLTPPPVVLPVPIALQETPVWCWAAVTEMSLRYRTGQSLAQCQMLEQIHGFPPGACCVPPAQQCARPAQGLQEVQQALMAFGGVRSIHTTPLAPMQLYSILQHGDPVIVHIRSGVVSSHVVVARGMRFEAMPIQTPWGGVIYQTMPFVLVNDPLSFMPNSVPYPQLANIWLDALIIKESASAAPSSPDPRPGTATTDGSATGGTTSDPFCGKLRRVVSAGPSFRSIQETAPTETLDDGTRIYESRIRMDGSRCEIWRPTVDAPSFYCALIARGSDCDAAENSFDGFASQIKSCLSDGWDFTEGPGHVSSIRKKLYASKTGRPDVDLTLHERDDGTCNVSLSIEKAD